MTSVAAVIVTRDSQRWIEHTLASVLGQSRPVDEVIVVDDGSTDGTPEAVKAILGDRGRVLVSTATATDRTTRIAHNFRQGLKEARSFDVAVLGDHDDVWHANRVGHQVGLLETWKSEAMVASDGLLVDENGRSVGGTLRSAFPVTIDWSTASPAERMRAVLRHSVATGGASALRPSAFVNVDIPRGWLHDRWWSLVATAQEVLRVDGDVVIDYRVSPGQQVGLDRGRQHLGSRSRIASAARAVGPALVRFRQVRALSVYATRATGPELSTSRLLRTLV